MTPGERCFVGSAFSPGDRDHPSTGWAVALYCIQLPMTGRGASRSCVSRGAGLGRFTRRKLIVCLAVASLSITLAGRVFHQSSAHGSSARSKADTAKIQHRDRLAQHWSVPVKAVHLPSPPAFVARVASAEEDLPGTRTDSCVYNRPPPCA
jgi:hypothetical protein